MAILGRGQPIKPHLPRPLVSPGGPVPIVGAFACFLQTPCDGNHAITQGQKSPGSQNDPASTSMGQISATVVAELPDDSSLTKYDSANSTNAYTFWKLDSQYFTTQNRAHCPIAKTSSTSSGGNTSVVVNLAPPQTKRVIRVSAERIGVLPTLPQPVDSYTDPSGATAVLLENNLVASAPVRSPDNKQVFRVAGEIVYGLLKPISAGSTLSLGFNSWESQTPTYKMIFPEAPET